MLLDLEEALLTLSASVRQARIANGWTVAELATRSGVTVSTIKRFERTGIITSDRLLMLLMTTGVAGSVLRAAASREHWTLEAHERLAKKGGMGNTASRDR